MRADTLLKRDNSDLTLPRAKLYPMTEPSENTARLEQLELKLMDVEVTIQQLNDVVLQQYRDIEALRQENSALHRKLDSINEPGPAPSAKDELPPHY